MLSVEIIRGHIYTTQPIPWVLTNDPEHQQALYRLSSPGLGTKIATSLGAIVVQWCSIKNICYFASINHSTVAILHQPSMQIVGIEELQPNQYHHCKYTNSDWWSVISEKYTVCAGKLYH